MVSESPTAIFPAMRLRSTNVHLYRNILHCKYRKIERRRSRRSDLPSQRSINQTDSANCETLEKA